MYFITATYLRSLCCTSQALTTNGHGRLCQLYQIWQLCLYAVSCRRGIADCLATDCHADSRSASATEAKAARSCCGVRSRHAARNSRYGRGRRRCRRACRRRRNAPSHGRHGAGDRQSARHHLPQLPEHRFFTGQTMPPLRPAFPQ